MICAYKVINIPSRYLNKSVFWNWDSTFKGIRRFALIGADITKDKKSAIVVIERDSESLCDEEMDGQISDGYFEDVLTDFDVKKYITIPNWIMDTYIENMPNERTN